MNATVGLGGPRVPELGWAFPRDYFPPARSVVAPVSPFLPNPIPLDGVMAHGLATGGVGL